MSKPTAYLVDGSNRRWFLKQSSALASVWLLPPLVTQAHPANESPSAAPPNTQAVTLRINRKAYRLNIEPRETLLDLMRERLNLTGSKKGCDHGQCGACTVHIDGRRANACLTLAIMQQNREIITIEGLANPGAGEQLHPLQTAFIKHDGFQCGFCTPGQIMSGAALLKEGHAGSASEIREWMSGNVCRCGAYPGIVAAIQSVQKGGVPG